MVAFAEIWASERTAAAPELSGMPAPLPSVAECPRQLCNLEVAPHPRGGWTIAAPIDATRTTQRLYRGQYSTRRRARAALNAIF